MLSYETFCYLQNQKTACTFVGEFLRNFSNEKLIRSRKHYAPRKQRRSKFYFVNVREPLDLYHSLFRYGLDSRGAVFKQLNKREWGQLYDKGNDGFEDWLRYILDPENANRLYRDYVPHARLGIGLATWRYLRLATFDFNYNKPAMDYVIRYENLVDDLSCIIRDHLAHALTDVPAALEWVASTGPINSSSRSGQAQDIKLSPETRSLLLEREKYLYNTFYPAQRDRLSAAT